MSVRRGTRAVRRIVVRTAFAGGGALLACLVLEVGLRLFGPDLSYGLPAGAYSADPDAGFVFTPNQPAARFVKHEFSTTVYTNADGFRDLPRGPKQAGAFRILSLGDSFVWGAYGTEREENYTALLQDALDRVHGRATSPLATRTRDLLLALAAACRQHGARLVLFLVPARWQVDAGAAADIARIHAVEPARLLAPLRFLERWGRAAGIPVTDPTDRFRERHAAEPLYWRLDPHLNAAGNRVAAEVLAEVLGDPREAREAAGERR